ncbi:conserved hypothetical protein [Tenacibaculum sp. 190524A02b]|uniref:Thioredoxin domain-containing protein n=1 Tax=Tenacibaculum vairaonense TaxID=3137860 RepID=A0ABM9PR78_9FLAO
MNRILAAFILMVSITLIGCGDNATKIKPTCFGGKIINPKGKYVTLSNNKDFTDTIYLKNDNTFFAKYKSIKKGLYYFEHGPEYQFIYLEPNDSLLLRLNTWDFDESLVYTGKNAERNNLLIEAFLEHEQDDKVFSKSYYSSESVFVAKIDSLLLVKEEVLKNYVNKYADNSKEFLSILDIALKYPVYTKLERFSIKNIIKNDSLKLSDSYFDYRKKLKLKRDSLIFYGSYYRYVLEKIYNDAFLKGYSEESEDFVVQLLHNIDEEIEDEATKNKVLYRTIRHHFNKRVKGNLSNKAFFTFFKLNTSIEDKKNIQRLINDIKQVENNKKMMDFKLEAPTGNWVDASKIIRNKKSIIYFKDPKAKSSDWIASRFNYLVKKYPDINFVYVNPKTKGSCFTKKIPIKYQYKLPENSLAYNFLTSKFSRLIIVDKDNVVQNGYSNLSAYDIEEQLKELQKN